MGQKRLTYIFLTLMLFFAVSTAKGQRYSFQNLGVDDGLVQSQPMCLMQDSTGNLWIGTLGGLSRYDGRTFTNYSIRNGLQSNMVQALAQDAHGNVWIGTRKGLSCFNGHSFQHFPVQSGNSGRINSSQQLTIAGDTVWWRAFGEIYFITAGKIKYFHTPVADNRITAFLLQPDGIWVAGNDSLYKLSQGLWRHVGIIPAKTSAAPYVHQIFASRDSGLLLATNMGLFRYRSNSFVPYTVAGQQLNWFSVRSITQSVDGRLWLATGNGAVSLDRRGVHAFNKRNGLSDNLFLDVMHDREGNIWLASDGQGIFRFCGTMFTVLDESMGLPSSQVVALASNKRDSLFIGTYEAGLFVYNAGKIAPCPIPYTPIPSITAMVYTRDRKLWVGTRDNGLFVYSRGTFRQYAAPHRGFPSNTIFSLYDSPDGKVYLGFGDGASVYGGDSFKVLPIPNERINSFLSIGEDSLLIATERTGLWLYHNGNASKFLTNSIVDSASINCFVTRRDELWLGSSDNGVIRYNLHSGTATAINRANGLRSDFIYNICTDKQENIWIGTGFGIHKIELGAGDQYKVYFYGKEMGVTGTESNINAVVKQADGSIWFGTTKGAIRYDPEATLLSSSPTAIVLHSVRLIGDPILDSSWYDSTDAWYGVPFYLHLPYKKNNIAFTFSAISLSGAGQLLYRYRLEGLDAPWSEWSTNTSVTFSALPPGKYKFVVECKGAGGDERVPQLEYELEIKTPFHKTIWFYLCVLVGCIVIGIALQAGYTTRKQRREELRKRLRAEEQAKVRLRTAEDFHDEVGNKLTRINVLTSIVKSKVGGNQDLARLLTQIEENTGQLYNGTRDILWSLKPTNDNLFEVLFRIHDFAGELFQDTDITFAFSGIDERWRKYKLPMDVNRNLTMIFKEALNNILKYSKCKNVAIAARMRSRDVCELVVTDDGVGFDLRAARSGNGLNNMMVRAERINGKLYVDSRPGKGTILTLTFRIPVQR